MAALRISPGAGNSSSLRPESLRVIAAQGVCGGAVHGAIAALINTIAINFALY
ncbi:hypothetical protein SynRCC2555_02427 [Synechococcus sp. WH 8101]|nr:hypothetical protein SynRCC2555_02427 [Synechococcus sp. WH 8101]